MNTQIQTASNDEGAGPSTSWQGMLDEAGSPDEVVGVARDFVARISPEEFSALPPDCRPHKLVDADDVVDYAVTLVRESFMSENSSDPILQHIATFFTHACTRLSGLGKHTPAATQ